MGFEPAQRSVCDDGAQLFACESFAGDLAPVGEISRQKIAFSAFMAGVERLILVAAAAAEETAAPRST